MKLKAYALMLARPGPKASISEAELKEVRRILGNDVCPLMASKGAAVIAFISTDAANITIERVKAAVGGQTQISVLELGLDQAQWGLPHHNNWLAHLRWLIQTADEKSS